MSYFYDPEAGHGLAHNPFKAIVAPRPIGWISTVDKDGRPNLAPYSFFNALCSVPPIVMFSSEGMKDSAANAMETGEFVVNLVSMALAQQMNVTAKPVPYGVDEMTLAGLEAAPCRMVRAPRVAKAPAALECRVLDVLELSDLTGQKLGRYEVLGQVVGVHLDKALITADGLFDTAGAQLVARCGYLDYALVDKVFSLPRPGTV